MNYSGIRAEARETMKNNWGTAIACLVIYTLLIGAASYTGGVLYILIVGPLAYGLTAMYLNKARGVRMEVNALFSGFNRYGDTLVLGLLQGLFIWLWTLLFIVPGIVKAYSYSMAWYIMHDEPGVKAKEALRKSEEMMDGHRGELFLLQLSFIGWWMLSIVTFGVAWFYVGPYVQAATTVFYQRLRGEATVYGSEPAAAQPAAAAQQTDAAAYAQAAEPARMGLFTGTGGGLAGIAYSLPDGAEYSVGSDAAQCAIVTAADESVAGCHCIVSYQAAEDAYRITDRSETGVCVNGVRIPANEAQTVAAGSEVTLGEGNESFRLG